MNSFFNTDNKFFHAISKIIDCVGLSALWLICFVPTGLMLYFAMAAGSLLFALPCILLGIPAGAATTALYYAVNKSVVHERGYVWREFRQSFVRNFKQCAAVSVILTAAAIVMAADIYIMYQYAASGEPAGAFYIIFLIMMAFLVMWGIYVFPYIARFENTVKLILKNTALIAIGNLWKTVVMFLLLAGMLLLAYLTPYLLLILPALYMLCINFLMEKIFRKYMSEEDLAAEDERNEL